LGNPENFRQAVRKPGAETSEISAIRFRGD
jgi:hypothetical protein